MDLRKNNQPPVRWGQDYREAKAKRDEAIYWAAVIEGINIEAISRELNLAYCSVKNIKSQMVAIHGTKENYRGTL